MGKNIDSKPYASYEYIGLNIEKYKEKIKVGSPMMLEIGESDTKTHRINLGIGIEYRLSKLVRLGGGVFNSNLYGDRNSEVLVKLQNDTNTYISWR